MLAWVWTVFAGMLGLEADNPQVVPSTYAGPQLFAPTDLKQAGRITFSPTFSADGEVIYFPQARCKRIWQCPQELMRSNRTDTGWSEPEFVAQTRGDRVEWPSFSPDGKELLFSWATDRPRHRGANVDVDFDLYRLNLGDPKAIPQPIDDPDINRIRGGKVRTLRFVHNETGPSLTKAGDLYFWTERLDGVGRRDVYLAKADGNGGFMKARPLSAPINTEGNDALGWVHPEGRLMLLSYGDRGGEGGGDIFVSTLEAGQWSEPRNLGTPVNSSAEEFAARLTPDGRHIVFTSSRYARPGDDGVFQVWHTPVSEVPELVKALQRVGYDWP
ncbi:hypothetical protein [Erythrobacter sp. F6033]|uniref:hypothetical protein n=1 Tax=Erythrobacter sp. F6033 TaxID=2926401 RepID=UPI001FF3C7D0|nr:hypothetical protein [Erythrobacter sp. F6033]MCK0127152.1 hypothetical protein [Erythrobacter sp. F6033]